MLQQFYNVEAVKGVVNVLLNSLSGAAWTKRCQVVTR